MKLLSRYVLREVFFAWLLVLFVLFVILMSGQFAEILGDAAANELPTAAVFRVFWLSALQNLTLIAPFASFLGIMIALARFNRDSETSALLACGFGPMQLLAPIAVIVATLGLLVAWLTAIAAPEAVRAIGQIKFEAADELELTGLEPGRFVAPRAGTVFYAERVEGEKIFDVFWAREAGDRVAVITAERGERVENPGTGELAFVLYNGTRHEGVPGNLDYATIEFAEHRIPVRTAGTSEFVESIEMRPTAALWRSRDALEQAELQWRLSSPLSLVLLAVLAVPLGRSSPREGRYARIGAGLLIFVTYYNLLAIARVWVERGQVPPWLGMWWVHGGFALLTLFLFGREAGWFARAPRVGPRVAL